MRVAINDQRDPHTHSNTPATGCCLCACVYVLYHSISALVSPAWRLLYILRYSLDERAVNGTGKGGNSRKCHRITRYPMVVCRIEQLICGQDTDGVMLMVTTATARLPLELTQN